MDNSIIDGNRTYSIEGSTDCNVFCYESGKLLWQIESAPKLHGNNSFTSIYIKENTLFAYSQNGIEVVIDKQSGKILKSELIK